MVHINVPFKLKGIFRDENQSQVIAIREALVNLLMHTDYFSNAKPRIRKLSDRIEFFNPGSLPKDIKYILKEEFSMPRNNTIASIFRTVKLSENIGSGFHKMFSGWTSYYAKKPVVESDFDHYKITFYLEEKQMKTGVKVGVKVGEKVGVKLTSNQLKIIDIIKENNHITAAELSSLVGISQRKIEENIKKLKDIGILKRIGPDKGGHWEVKQNITH